MLFAPKPADGCSDVPIPGNCQNESTVRRRVTRVLGCTVAAALLTVTPAGALLSGQGLPRPDPQRTPGAANPAVTQDDIDATICRSGYTRSVRHVTITTKKQVFAEYEISYAKHGGYEVDHLIPLELGGSNDIRNLWPEPYQAAAGARAKDKIENALHALVCAHQSALAAAQLLIANKWTTALQTVTTTPGSIPVRRRRRQPHRRNRPPASPVVPPPRATTAPRATRCIGAVPVRITAAYKSSLYQSPLNLDRDEVPSARRRPLQAAPLTQYFDLQHGNTQGVRPHLPSCRCNPWRLNTDQGTVLTLFWASCEGSH